MSSAAQSSSSPSVLTSAAEDPSRASEQLIQLTEKQIVQTLQHGAMEEAGLLPYSSNYSFLVTVTPAVESTDQRTLPAVYKPRRGENPLWDFTTGTLCQREVAAYAVSHTLGWDLVPPTVLREGEHGIGSVQFYIQHDANEHYFTFQCDARFAQSLRQLVLFDFVINNADRKSGHCLAGADDRLWAIDHGICFHDEYKLRTVIWEFSGEEIAADMYNDLCSLQAQLRAPDSDLNTQLTTLLSDCERDALHNRLDILLRSQCYPSPPPHMRNYPWPPV